jgi:hypothetical protein
MFLRADEAETETGDLLEAYRDSIYPNRGRRRANFWYVRQVAGYVLRASAGWGAIFAVVWGIGPFRMLLAQNPWYRGDVEPKAIAAMVFLLAARRTWRTERIQSGVLMAIGIAAVGSPIWIGFTMFQAAMWDASMTAVQSLRHNFDWAPFVMIPLLAETFAIALGLAGATTAKLVRATVK